jgi:hypothetical protein
MRIEGAVQRGGPGCLNNFSAGVRLPSEGLRGEGEAAHQRVAVPTRPTRRQHRRLRFEGREPPHLRGLPPLPQRRGYHTPDQRLDARTERRMGRSARQVHESGNDRAFER